MSQAQSLVGEKLGSFRIESVVGSGAMGVVYKATNEKTGRIAAVKVVSAEFAQGGKIRDRFEREAEILQQFRHPNIVRFLAVGRFQGTSYLAMEFVEGSTLEKSILDRGSLPWLEVVDLAIQICDALHYAHQHGVVHRDLKPSNLMLTADGKIKLTDFGIAKDLDATALTGTGRTLGTAAYMAPEQIRGNPPVSHKTDLYALGVVLYQLVVGKPPFEGGTPVVLMHSHLNEPAPRPSARVHEIPKALDELIVTLMAKAPADRPWDAAAVGVKLTELRDKVNRGASIAMVWPSSEPGAKSSRGTAKAAAEALPSPTLIRRCADKKKPRKAGTLSRSTGKDRTISGLAMPRFDRSTLETAGLVAVLVAIAAFITYWLWPPSAEYLHQKAEVLMASTRRSDWKTARDEYIKELDDRFPDHPYKEQTRAWRDKILLEDAEYRGRNLASGLNISMTEPSNDAERAFKLHHQLAANAAAEGDELAAVRHWQEMANELAEAAKPHKDGDPEERQWYLLALKRVGELENRIKDRGEYVQRRVEAAQAAFRAGRPNEALQIQAKLREEFGKFTDLRHLFAPDENANASGSDASKSAPGAAATRTPPADDGGSEASPKTAGDSGESKDRPESPPADGSQAEPPARPVPKDERPES